MSPEEEKAFYDKAAECGKRLIESKNKRLQMMSNNCGFKHIDDHKVCIVNASIEQSDLGNYLVTQKDTVSKNLIISDHFYR